MFRQPENDIKPTPIAKNFRTIRQLTTDGYEYRIMAPILSTSTIMLFDTDDQPLVAIGFDTHSAESLVTRYRDDDAITFAAISSVDNGRYDVLVSNMLNPVFGNGTDNILGIDLLTENVATTTKEVRDRIGINRVNGIRAGQTVRVASDTRLDERVLKLRGVRDGSGAAVTVGEDRAVAEDARCGSRLYVNVVAAAANTKLVERLANAHWRCVDVFMMRKKVILRHQSPFQGSYDSASSNMPRVVAQSRSSNTSSFFGGMTFGTSHCDVDRGGETMLFSTKAGPPLQRQMASAPPPGRVDANLAEIDQAQAAEMVVGHKRCTIKTQSQSLTMAYDRAAPRACLTMCVWMDLFTIDAMTDAQEREYATFLIDQDLGAINEAGLRRDLVAMDKVYTASECVVCMDDNDRALQVIVRCGHRCVCSVCSIELVRRQNACPMCRGRIVRTIDASVLERLVGV